MCEVHFNLHGTSGFHVKAENEKFIPACSFCRQNFILEKFTLPFGRLRQKNCTKKRAARCPCLTNHIINLWRCRCRGHFVISPITERFHAILLIDYLIKLLNLSPVRGQTYILIYAG